MKLIATHRGETVPVEVIRDGGAYRVRIGERWMTVDLVAANRSISSLRMEDGTQYQIVHEASGPNHHVSFSDTSVHLELHDPLAMKRSRKEDEAGGSGRVIAIMPGRVTRVIVQAGQTVRKGEPILILEAMKMENEIQAPRAGEVTEVHVAAGVTVEGGAILVTIS